MTSPPNRSLENPVYQGEGVGGDDLQGFRHGFNVLL